MTSTRPNVGRPAQVPGFVTSEDYDEDDSYDDLFRELGKKYIEDPITPSKADGEYEDNESSSDLEELVEDLVDDDFYPTQRLRPRKRAYTELSDSLDDDSNGRSYKVKQSKLERRRSERGNRNQKYMAEKTIDDIYTSETEKVSSTPKVIAAHETFHHSSSTTFIKHHTSTCDTCGEDSSKAPLIPCQGCTLSYHQECLGPRASRQHLATKIGEDKFVLQCKRCVAKQKDIEPVQSLCQACHNTGSSCAPFSIRKTASQEQKLRNENNGIDPITEVDLSLIDSEEDILQRCGSCYRGWHFEHIPRKQNSDVWECEQCISVRTSISNIIAWRLVDFDSFDDDLAFKSVAEDEKEYLVKLKDQSYAHAMWVPGAWLHVKTSATTRKAFQSQLPTQQPKLTKASAIPRQYLIPEVILDVHFATHHASTVPRNQVVPIHEVHQALIKYKGLSYDETFWDGLPDRDDAELWSAFVEAYESWLTARVVLPLSTAKLGAHKLALRRQASRLVAQPAIVTGGKLMGYQLDGVNWLYHKWCHGANAILGDEMGLGKTIQVISFISALVEQIQCFPFLIVVPNSTCPNWKREFKKWSPSLAVSTFYGSKKSRDTVANYELFPGQSIHMRRHVVIMSYEAAGHAKTGAVFRSVKWQGLVVDEGQRLKNNETQLYQTLRSLQISFKILLTGTPLQNNQRELFNLLHFLDKRHDAEKLEQQYEHLDENKISEIHEKIRPYFLRRTKRQVLTFLPPMKQVVLPVSMSSVQKVVHRTILSKNATLMRAIFGADASQSTERSSLNNILMQLRKCLCHPFVYNQAIEERVGDTEISHRNLVDASGKLKLLELMLPMLHADGHRVLVFSQFLDMLTIVEDFLTHMSLPYQRLDGTVASLDKQKRIDAFNAPGSTDFAFLLSTRAGGVGINLATADTVIILDPDFNPHQDLQALSRAHRIGQTKKVLCLQLVTIASAEERIMAVGKRKLALEQALIQNIDAEESTKEDLLSILRHGVEEVFKDDSELDIMYDEDRLSTLLDRTTIEDDGDTTTKDDLWSSTDVWKQDQSPTKGSVSNWDKIMKTREQKAAKEAKARASGLGRGRRQKNHVDYSFKAAAGLATDADLVHGIQRDEDIDFVVASDGDSDDDVKRPGRKIKQATSTLKKSGRITRSTTLTIPSLRSTRGKPAATLGRISKINKVTKVTKKPVARSKKLKVVESDDEDDKNDENKE